MSARRSWLPILLPVLLVSLLLLGAVAVPLPYYAIGPAPVQPANRLVRVPPGRAYPPKGEVLLTSVSLRPATAMLALQGWVDGDVAVVPRPQVLGSGRTRQSPRDLEREIELSMESSRHVAVVAALRHLGIPVTEHGSGALVAEVVPGSSADGRLIAGDVITGVDRRPTPLADQAVEAIRAHRPGETVVLDVVASDGTPRAEDVVLGSRAEDPAAFLGVALRTKDERLEYPFEVRLDDVDIGGASGGLAFALAVIDVLTPGELTGGRVVAATGGISSDGRVREVDGVPQKAAAARDASALHMLVPVGAARAALGHAGTQMKVVEIGSLAAAVDALVAAGGERPAPITR